MDELYYPYVERFIKEYQASQEAWIKYYALFKAIAYKEVEWTEDIFAELDLAEAEFKRLEKQCNITRKKIPDWVIDQLEFE